MKIGLIDSGLGGLTVLAEALKQLPDEEFLYYADSKNAPYGSKPPAAVLEYVSGGVGFLIDKGAEVIVIACNTATSIAAPTLRKTYDVPILGMEPAVKPAMELRKGRRVLVTATPLTLKEEKMKQLLKNVDPYGFADLVALPCLVEFAERHDFSNETVLPYLKDALSHLDLSDYGSVVLGCTHFPFFSPQFESLLKNARLIDGSVGTVRHLVKTIQNSEVKTKTKTKASAITYFVSGQEVKDLAEIEKFSYLLSLSQNQ